MKKIIYNFLFAVLFSFPNATQACSCDYYIDFCETVSTSMTVIEGEILSIYNIPSPSGFDVDYMDIVITEYLHNALQEDTFSVFIGYGTSCDPIVDSFYVGGRLIIGFEEVNDTLPDHYPEIQLVSACSINFLYPDSYDLATFKENLESCLLTTFLPERIELLERVAIFPNPVSNSLFVNSPFGVQPMEVRLIAANGQVIFDFQIANSGNNEYDLSYYPKGVYFVEIRIGDISATKKILKY